MGLKVATISFHKNLSRYPEKWIDDYRLSIENQVTKTPIFEIDYGCEGERIFKDSQYYEVRFSNHAQAHNFLCEQAVGHGFDFVANTNVDDLYHQERILRQLPYCEKYDVVSCDMTQIDGENRITRENILFSQMNIREHAEKGHNILAHPACIYSKNFIENSGLLIPSEIPKDDFNLWKRSYDKFSFFIAPLRPAFLPDSHTKYQQKTTSMSIKDIVFIIPNFNQLTFLRGLINQIRWYYPDNRIIVVDNGSTYAPLLKYYELGIDFELSSYTTNDFVGNLSHELAEQKFEYYVITDPDLSIHPATPPNFLEIFKTAIDVYGFHHAGFGLKVDDLPPWNPKAGWIRGDELALLNSRAQIEHEGVGYAGFKAPIDTTFALYKRGNGGWKAPMDGASWGNCIRLFELHHLPWYLDANKLNPEMENYYNTCLKRDAAKPSAGRTNYVPEKPKQ